MRWSSRTPRLLLLMCAVTVPGLLSLVTITASAPPAAAQFDEEDEDNPGRALEGDDVVWAVPMPERRQGTVYLDDDRGQVLFPTERGVSRVSYDGDPLSEWRIPGGVHEIQPWDDLLVFSNQDGFTVLDPVTGQIEDTHRLGSRPPGRFSVAQGEAWFTHRTSPSSSGDSLGKVDLATGVLTYNVLDEGTAPGRTISIRVDTMTTTSEGHLLMQLGGSGWILDVSGEPTTVAYENLDSSNDALYSATTMWSGTTEYEIDDLSPTGRTLVLQPRAVGERLALDIRPSAWDMDTGEELKRLTVVDGSVDPFGVIADDPLVVINPDRGVDHLARMTLAPVLTDVSPDHADPRAGPVVTIEGSGFAAATAVRFGGVPALDVTIESGEKLVVTAPDLAVGQNHAITVETPFGTSRPHPFWSGSPPGMTTVVYSTLDGGYSSLGEVTVDITCRAPDYFRTADIDREQIILDRGSTTVRAYEPGTFCGTYVSTSGSSNTLSGFVEDGEFRPIGAQSLRWEVGPDEQHVAFRHDRSADGQPLRLATVVVGEPVGSPVFDFRMTCTSSQFSTTFQMQGTDELDQPAGGECTVELVGDGGAMGVAHVVSQRGSTSELSDGRSATAYVSTTHSAGYPEMTFYVQFAPAPFQYPLVIGSPGEDLGARTDAGMVTVLATDARGLLVDGQATNVTQGSRGVPGASEAGDRWGAATAVADFDLDGYDDIAVGAPGEDIGSIVDAGAVTVLYGDGQSPAGKRADAFHQRTPGIPGGPERGDQMGAALTTMFWDTDDYPDLVIGLPGEDVGSIVDAGGLIVVRGGPAGLDASRSTWIDQSSPGIGGGPETGDGFATALAGNDRNLLVGVPAEDVGDREDAGIVHLIRAYRSEDQVIQQSSISGLVEAGDRFGAAVALNGHHLLIGTPGEAVGSRAEAGVANYARIEEEWWWGDWRTNTTESYTQNHQDMAGTAEAGDRFGAAVAIVDDDFLVIGAPGESIGSRDGAGMVNVSNNGSIHQDRSSIPGKAEAGDGFGSSLALGSRTNVLIIGVPGEGIGSVDGAGLVTVLGFSDSSVENVHASSPGVPGRPERGDGFGTAVGAS